MADNKKSKFIRFGDYVVLRGEQTDKKNEQKNRRIFKCSRIYG